MSDERLNRIEARYAWLEKHVAGQDRAMLEMAEQLSRLRQEMLALRERAGGGLPASGQPEDPPEPPPPHY